MNSKDTNRKPGTSWKPGRARRIAAGVALAAISVAGIAASTNGASAGTYWGRQAKPTATVAPTTGGTGGTSGGTSAMMSTSWG
jgi:hypothetical protein